MSVRIATSRKAAPTIGRKKAASHPIVGRTSRVEMPGTPISTAPFAPPSPTTIPAGKFKAICLKLLDRSAEGETITITKRGKIVGRLVPPEPPAETPFRPLLGRLKGKVTIHGDIVGPDLDAWKLRR